MVLAIHQETELKRTSLSIARRLKRLRTITAHISPYANGLAPETRVFVAALNAEAKRHGIDVEYVALANKIEARGDVARAAADPTTLGGWFLSQGIGAGYLEGQEPVMKRWNSEQRKHLRRRAKTKAGMAEAAAIEAEANRKAAFIQDVAAAGAKLHELIRELPQTELDRLEIDPTDFRRARVHMPLRSSHPLPREKSRRAGWRVANSTSFRKGGPNPRRRNPDS
jgi:hypothetical protein